MSGHPEGSRWGWFALVCYISDPLKSAVDRLKRMIPSKDLPEAHITVLPPRPLAIPIEEACRLIRSVIDQFASFEAELSDVCRFAETDFLYLDIAEGKQRLCDIHAALNTFPLACQEVFEFRPHLTLGGPVPAPAIENIRQSVDETWKAMEVRRSVPINEFVCLWLAPEGQRLEWTRLRSFSLPEAVSNFAADVPGVASRTY